ncbi:MAG: hypothetical protein ACK58L_15710 [Planctomycetota bacterium]
MLEFNRRYQSAIHSGLLFVLGMISFWPSVHFDFVNWDDPIYVQNNPTIRSWSAENLKQISTEVIAKNYAPLTSLSFMLDYSFWGLNPCGYHATNVILHLVNGVLVYFLICQITGSCFVGFFTASLFLVHPVQVESVAWISSRKGLLCSMFMLGACIVRMRHDSSPKVDGRYSVLLASALLCKAHAVVLPAIMLCYDLLILREEPRRAIPRQVIPGLMSLALLVITMSAQNSMIGGVRTHMSFSLLRILAIDVTILWKYLGMLLMPTSLCVMYDPPVSGIWKQVILGSIGMFSAALLMWKHRRTRPWWLMGCLTILLLLFPMLNVFRITTLMNDRYLYLPCIVVFASALTILKELLDVSFESLDGMLAVLASGLRTSLASVFVLAAIILTSHRLPVWADAESLWADASKKCPTLPVVRIQAALTAHARGDIQEALDLIRIALRETNPDDLDRDRMREFIADWTVQLAEARSFQKPSVNPSEFTNQPSPALNAPANVMEAPAVGAASESASTEEAVPFLSSVK